MTQFVKGDLVRGLKDVQGLVINWQYKVVEVNENPTPFGNFVVYEIESTYDGRRLEIANGQFVLEFEASARPAIVTDPMLRFLEIIEMDEKISVLDAADPLREMYPVLSREDAIEVLSFYLETGTDSCAGS